MAKLFNEIAPFVNRHKDLCPSDKGFARHKSATPKADSDTPNKDNDAQSDARASSDSVGPTHSGPVPFDPRHILEPRFADQPLTAYRLNMTATLISPHFGTASTSTYPRTERIGSDAFIWTSATRGTFLIDGVQVRMLQRSEAWHYEFPEFAATKTTARGTHRATTKLRDLAAAIRFAKDIYFTEKQHHLHGTSSKVPSAEEVSRLFLADLKARIVPDHVRPARGEASRQSYRKAERFLLGPFKDICGPLKMTMIDPAAVALFHLDYAKRNAEAGYRPAQGGESKNKAEGIVKRLVTFALAHRLIAHDPLAGLQKSGRSRGSDGIVDHGLWQKMESRLIGWPDEAISTQSGKARQRAADERLWRVMLRGLIYVLRMTGVRPAEALALKVGDVDLFYTASAWGSDGEAVEIDCVRIQVFGDFTQDGKRKGNKKWERRVILAPSDIRPFLMAVLADHPRKSDPRAPLFANFDGGKITDPDKKFAELFDDMAVKRVDAAGDRIVLGSFRHAFITEMRQRRVIDSDLARYTNSSTAMFDRFYDKTTRMSVNVGAVTGKDGPRLVPLAVIGGGLAHEYGVAAE